MLQESPSSDFENYRPISITFLLAKVFEKIVAEKLNNFLESNSLLPPQFSYRRNLRILHALHALFYHLQVALNRGMEERLVQLGFSAAFDRVNLSGLLYTLRSIGVGGEFLSINIGVP